MEETNKIMGSTSDRLQREWAKIVAQAWADPDFRQRLEKNPRAVLKERGVNVPANINLNVIDKPLALEDIEHAIRPLDMAVAAGFAAAPVGAPQPAYTPPYNGVDYYTGGYGYPSSPYTGAADPTLEGRGKVGLCINTRATIGACAFFQWGAGQPFPQQAFPQQPFPTQQPQAPMPAASYGPPQPQQPPTAAWAGDPYSSGAMDPTLEGRGKVGLCINVPVTGGVCAYVHWGAGQPYPAQPIPAATYASPQFPPTSGWAGAAETLPYYPGNPYATGAMDPTLEGRGKVGLCISSRITAGVCAYVHWGAGQPFPVQQEPMAQPPTPAASYATPVQPQQPTAGWAATVPTQCFGGAMSPPFVPPGHPSQQQFHIQPSPGPGPQTRPANPGSA